jgi:hypothetical protein
LPARTSLLASSNHYIPHSLSFAEFVSASQYAKHSQSTCSISENQYQEKYHFISLPVTATQPLTLAVLFFLFQTHGLITNLMPIQQIPNDAFDNLCFLSTS